MELRGLMFLLRNRKMTERFSIRRINPATHTGQQWQSLWHRSNHSESIRYRDYQNTACVVRVCGAETLPTISITK